MRVLGFAIFMLLFAQLWAQDIEADLQKANLLLQKEDYQQAAAIYDSRLEEIKGQYELYPQIIEAYFNASQQKKAKRLIDLYLNEVKKPAPKAFFLKARILHEALDFEEAAVYYKKYLSTSDLAERSLAIKNLLHCQSGIDIQSKKKLAFVNPLSDYANSIYDEIAPYRSPNNTDRIYVSGVESSKRNLRPLDFDVLKIDRYNGNWALPNAVNDKINSAENEILYGFNEEGNVAIYLQYSNGRSKDVHTDTFSTIETEIKKGNFLSPFQPQKGDKDLQVVNDKLILFAKLINGQYDIVASYRDGKTWSNPQPLPDYVNSVYHDRTPYLSPYGNYLYFASDRKDGIGGFDLYRAAFEDGQWQIPEHLGMEINSASDDMYFCMLDDGFSAIICSNRKSGKGGYDLYNVNFLSSLRPKEIKSVDPKSMFFGDIAKTESELHNTGNNAPWIVRSFTFEEEQEILSQAQLYALNQMANKLKAYPNLELSIISYNAFNGPKKLDLYFSFKRAELAAQSLVANGIEADRLHITACGSSYPAIVIGGGSQNNIQLNRRIDFLLHSKMGKKIPFEVIYDPLVPRVQMANTPYASMRDMMQGLAYSVQIVATEQVYDSPYLENYRNALIRAEANKPALRYTLGIFKSYHEAKNLRARLIADGLKGAFITAYIDGVRKTREELRNYLENYPDLERYIKVE